MDKGSGAVRRVPFWRSLQTKFALTYIVIVAAVLILLNTYPLVVSEKLAYQSKQASMLNQASVLASALATGPEALTAEGATRTVELLRGPGSDPGGGHRPKRLGALRFPGRRGADRHRRAVRPVLGAGHRPAGQQRVPLRVRRRGLPKLGGGAHHLPLHDPGGGLPLRVRRRAGRAAPGIQTNLRFISIVICMVSLVMGVVFSKALTRRIAQLLRGIHTVREGEYSHRVSVRGGDELSRLADEFNELTGRLQTTEEVRRRFVSDASHELKNPTGLHPPAHRLPAPGRPHGRRDGTGVPQRHRGRG